MQTKQNTFDRFITDVTRGDTPRDADVSEMEQRAAAIHNKYPQKIDALNAELKSVKTRLDATRLALEARTEAIVQAVTMARTPEGKTVFSNESLRSIEIKKRTAADPQCAIELAEIEALEEQHNMNVVLLQRAQNDYSAWKDMIRIELASRPD